MKLDETVVEIRSTQAKIATKSLVKALEAVKEIKGEESCLVQELDWVISLLNPVEEPVKCTGLYIGKNPNA